MGCLGLCHHQDAGGVAVQAVDDPRPFHAADAGQVLTMGKEGVHQRPRGASRPRVDHHAGRLVDDEKIRILIADVERNHLRCEGQGHGGWDAETNALAGAQAMAGFLRVAPDQDVPVRNEPLDAGPGQATDSGHVGIQPLARLRPRDDELPEIHCAPSGHPSDRKT